ncbi:MAG: hypothetical protein QM757_33295 [Paludibaculum sp.]
MSVFTILNCGTNFDRSKRGELVADFGAMLNGEEYKDFLITDGVGSKGTTANPMPGTFGDAAVPRGPQYAGADEELEVAGSCECAK